MLSQPGGAIDGSVRLGTCRYMLKSDASTLRSKMSRTSPS